MSASLVGSEMCIRDRPLYDVKHRRTRHVERLRGEPRSPRPERPERLADKALSPQPAATLRPRLPRGA
eukprot:9706305-Alexandrium_andersonii.AAC.1